MAHWPAMERWRRPSYLHGVAGPRTVPVEVGRHYLADGWGQRLMPLSDFIDRHVLQRPAGELRRPDTYSCPSRHPSYWAVQSL